MIRPLKDKILIKMVQNEETTKSSIILPSNSKEKSQIATVIECGPGGEVNGHNVEMIVKKGDKVIVSKYAGTEIKYEGEDLIIVSQEDVLAIIE